MKYTFTDAELASRQKRERAASQDDQVPIKIGRVEGQPLRKVPQKPNIAFRSHPPFRVPAVKQVLTPTPAGIPSEEALRNRELEWAGGTRDGTVKGSREKCDFGAGKVVPARRHRDT